MLSEKRKQYLKEYRIKNRKKAYEYRKKWIEKHPGYMNKYHYDNNGIRRKAYSDYFKNASPISKSCIIRHGLNALLVYQKYNGKCAYCEQDWDLTIHHLDNKGRNYLEKGLKPNNNIDNLIVLCRKCHGRIHGKQNRDKFKQ
jgi:hypothetical protein